MSGNTRISFRPAVITNHGGLVVGPPHNELVDGITTVLFGDLHICPICCHGVTPIIATGFSRSGGIPNGKVGDFACCGAMIVVPSKNTNSDRI